MDKLKKEYLEQDRRFRDKFLEARFGLWNSLITINGIIITAISLVSIIKVDVAKYNVLIILGTSIFSISFLLFNYYHIKEMYYELGVDFSLDDMNQTEISRKENKAKTLHDKIYKNEIYALICFGVEIIFLFILFI